jgi:hypothetical protein
MTLPKTAHHLSAAQAKSRLADCLRKAEHGEPVSKNAPTGEGLAGLAGGWKGSENLVRSLGKLRRTRPRRTITLA